VSKELSEHNEAAQPNTPRRADTFGELLANRPFIICALYFGTYFTGFSCVAGAVLAHLFKGGQAEEWEESHYVYLIRTFWILFTTALIALTGGIALAAIAESIWVAVLFGLLFFTVLIFGTARTAYSMINAVRHQPMPRPRTFLI
jgi:uncharacterized membrane protein